MSGKPRLAVDNTSTRDTPTRGAGQRRAPRPTQVQLAWLQRGLGQPGGKLPLFDANGQRVRERTVRSCIDQGWAEPWFENPIKPGWLVCKLTGPGRLIADYRHR